MIVKGVNRVLGEIGRDRKIRNYSVRMAAEWTVDFIDSNGKYLRTNMRRLRLT